MTLQRMFGTGMVFAAALGGASIGLPAANAAPGLDGKTITTAFYFPDQSTIGFGGVPVDSVVGPGIEIAASPQGFPITSIDFSNDSIDLAFSTTLTGTVATFNGWRFYDASNNLPAFTGATLVTTLPGWAVTFDGDNIWLNGSGAQYFTGSTLHIGVTTAAAVPEPSSGALGLLGIGALALLGRRRSGTVRAVGQPCA